MTTTKHRPEYVTTEHMYTHTDDNSAIDELLTDILGHKPALTQVWRVTWPDHVLSPKFNSDASYQPISPREARAIGREHGDDPATDAVTALPTKSVEVRKIVGDDARCLWQIVPSELPPDLPDMALELWVDGNGRLHMFQFLVDGRGDQWWRRIQCTTRFEHVV